MLHPFRALWAARPALPSVQSGWCFLLLYFAAHVVGRWWVSPALELDEAEQALWTQQLQWGYGAQPPLYTWLQWGVFEVLGASVLSLSLLKNALLALAYAFVYLGAVTLMPAGLAALAAASMLLLPQIGWEASRDLTHSVLLTTLCAATLAVTLHLLRRPRPSLFLLGGLVVGLGMLSKYSYAGFVAVLVAALVTGADTRRLLFNRWALTEAAIAALVVLPHAMWLQDHWALATSGTLDKMTGMATVGRGLAWAQALGSLAVALLAFGGLWALTVGLLFGRAIRGRGAPDRAASWDVRAFWCRYGLALGLLFVAMVLVGDVTRFKDRWMMPFLFLLPLALFSCSPSLAWHPAVPRLRRVLTGVATAVVLLMTARAPFHAWRDQPDELNEPVKELAQAVRQLGYTGTGTIVATDRALAGSLRLQFPAARVEVGGGKTALPVGRPLLLITSLGSNPSQVTRLVLPYRFSTSSAGLARYDVQIFR